MQSRVTLREVAAKAGLHHTTVSRALKGDPRVCAETLAKIRALAEEMGYTPDPMLSALNAYRQASRPAPFHGTVAWITNFPERDGWHSRCYQLYFDGASDQLKKHGYRLEEYWLREPGMTARRASQVLINRGIRGLLICPLAISRGHLSLQWEKFSAVCFGYSLVRPRLHLFSSAHYRAIISGMRKLRAVGYRRVGMVTSYDMNERMDRMWTAAYVAEMGIVDPGLSIPISFLGSPAHLPIGTHEDEKKTFLKWYRTYKPEAIISPTVPVLEWLTEEGYSVPKEVTVISASLQTEERLSGIVEASHHIGCAAANFLVGMLQRGEYGVPPIPQRVLLEGNWYDGKTVRPRSLNENRRPKPASLPGPVKRKRAAALKP